MKCCVSNCFHYYDGKKGVLSFFQVPSDPNKLNAWIAALPESNRPLTKYSKICSAHFLEQDLLFCTGGRTRLNRNAVPSIFNRKNVQCQDSSFKEHPEASTSAVVTNKVEEISSLLKVVEHRSVSQQEIVALLTEQQQEDIDRNRALIQQLQEASTTSTCVSKEEKANLQAEAASQPQYQCTGKRELKNKKRRSLKWALECTDEDGKNREHVLMQKISILRKHIHTKNLKINSLKAKLYRKSRKCNKISEMFSNLSSNNYLNEDDRDALSNMPDSSRSALEKELFQEKRVTNSKPYSEVLKKFALELNFYSPRAYVYVRESMSSCLPHPRTIKRWYSSSQFEPGFTNESFEALRAAVQIASADNQKLVCNLVFDEMAVRERIEWNNGKTYGYVDIGNGGNSDVKATQVLAFMVVCINRSWKLPVGYFPIASITAEQKRNLLIHCIGLLIDTGVVLLGVTFDGAANNVTLARILGCDLREDKPNYTFQIEGIDETFCIFPDACHMIKLVRNVFAELSPLVNASGQQIDFKYLIELEKLQESEGFHLANKLKRAHVYFQRQNMKVKLATQLLSKSVADAIDFCRTKLQLPQFAGSEATAQFIHFLNDAFDILNSRKTSDFGYKQALTSHNFPEISRKALEICDYLQSIKLQSGEFLVQHRRWLGFVGIIVCLRNLSFVKEKILMPKTLKYVPTYKLNQDHVELMFSVVRCRLGYNDNPTVKQFRAAYMQLVVHCQIREGGIGNAIPLENISILQCSRPPMQNPLDAINTSVTRIRMIEDASTERTAISSGEEICEAFYTYPDTLTEFAEKVVEYIAGFIVFKLQKTLHCTSCLSALESEMSSTSFIAYKSFGYLKTPSNCVKKICEVTEKMLKGAMASLKAKTTILSSKEFQKIVILVQRNLMDSALFVAINDHFRGNDHYSNLIKLISEKYLDIRFHAIARRISQKDSIRNHHHRLILFQECWKIGRQNRIATSSPVPPG